MAGFFRHPILRVVFLGFLVGLVVLILRGPSVDDGSSTIIIAGADLLDIRAQFQRTWQREPTPTELRGAIEQFVRREVLYREALARGYDRDDPSVRVAMQQKMEFLAVAQIEEKLPTDAEVEAFFALRQERYRIPAVFSFIQVYVNPDRSRAELDRIAGDLLARLRAEDPGPDSIVNWGDRTMLRPVHDLVTSKQLDSEFGGDFGTALNALEPGTWQGPVESGFGLHLVKVLERVDSRLPELSEVLSDVIRDMQYEAAQAAREQLYQEVAQNYRVVLDRPVRELLESDSE